MLQSLSNLLSGDSHALQLLTGVVILAVVLAVLYGLYRLLFAHRLRVPGASRSRAPRLGVVDVYGLDGQRQLVIVRRDNTEHLLMIGGPNDLVIESQILRNANNGAGARDSVKATATSAAENAIEAPPPASPIPRPVAPAPMPANARRNPARPAQPAAEAAAPPVVSTTSPEAAPAPPVAAPEPPPLPAEVRVRVALRPETVAPKPPAEPAAPTQAKPLEGGATPESPPKPAVEAPAPRKPLAPPRPVALATRPALPSPITPLRPRSGSVSTPTGPASESPRQAGVEPSAAKVPDVIITPPPASPAGEKPHGRTDEAFYDLESLEAEMARLLGRDG